MSRLKLTRKGGVESDEGVTTNGTGDGWRGLPAVSSINPNSAQRMMAPLPKASEYWLANVGVYSVSEKLYAMRLKSAEVMKPVVKLA